MLLTGIFAPIATPFYLDGAVYLRKLEHNVDRYCRSPLAGLVVLGSTGEPVMLSDEERREVLRQAVQAAAAEKVLIAGAGAESVRETLALCEYAAGLSYDAVLVRTPHYYKPHLRPENIVAVEALAGSPGASAASAAAKPRFKTRTKNAGFQILAGSAHLLQESLEAGAVGAVLAFADIAPTACFEILAAWKDRDQKLACEKQERIAAAAKRIVSFYGIPGIKYG